MSWRNHLLNWTGPGIFGGIAFDDWFALLKENRFAVDPQYWWRAAIITLGSVRNSMARRRGEAAFGERVRNTVVEPPLFLLGVWRSGTTHLHNLFAVDERFAFPNWFQVAYPHRFLSVGSKAAAIEGWFVPRRRMQDNMEFGFHLPAEEEFALLGTCGISPMLSWVFPRSDVRYNRYLKMRDVAPDELARWKQAFLHFVKKLSYQCRKPLVLKSPPHTGRIRLLLELFPEARFVHICRNPYAVYPSAVHNARAVMKYCSLQRLPSDVEDRSLRDYAELFNAYFDERGLIGAGRLCEVRYEELEQDPLGQMRKIYAALSLPDFHEVEPALGQYVASQAGYRKNLYTELPPETKIRIARDWRRCFDEWGYAT